MKFNTLKRRIKKVMNYEGTSAYRLSPEVELYTSVVTSSISGSFYESDKARIKRIQELISKCNPVFVVQLAIYTRTEMYLRSIPIVLMVELSKIHSGDRLVSHGIAKVVRRADEITELLAYYQHGRKGQKKLNRLSKQVQKGLAMVFNKFDEYQFAKYNRPGEIKLKDALFLAHPKAKNDAQQLLFNKIVNNDLSVPYTWETEISSVGQQALSTIKDKKKLKQEKWEGLIKSGKMGYMALLRNLRNIIEAEVAYDCVNIVCDRISDPDEVARSKQLPFRFLAAYRQLKLVNSDYTTEVLNAIEDAVIHTARNIAGFGRNVKTLVACDVSGSMQKKISERSEIMLFDIGLMLGMILKNRCNRVVAGMFGNDWKIINMPSRSILQNVQEFYSREGEVGYSTNGYKVVADLIKRKVVMDKVMIFTDTQFWNSTFSRVDIQKLWCDYKKDVAPKAKLYLFDLAGYGNVPISVERNDVFIIAGWSDKIFDILAAIENGSSAIKEIQKVEIY